MSGRGKVFDFCMSFGGSCAGTMQLTQRNLRMASLPFDWVGGRTSEKFSHVIEKMLASRFEGWMQYGGFVPMPAEFDDPPATDPMEVRVWDNNLDMGFWHDFRYNIFASDGKAYFDGVVEKYRRRIDRLYDFLSRSENVLAVSVAQDPCSRGRMLELKQRLDAVSPKAKFTLFVVQYGADEDSPAIDDGSGVFVRSTRRKVHPYDYYRTAPEWDFLDDVKLTGAVAFSGEGKSRVKTTAGMPLWYKLHRKLYMHCRKVLEKQTRTH